MAIWGTKPTWDVEEALLPSHAEGSKEVIERPKDQRLVAKAVAAVLTVFLLSGCMVSLYTHS